MERLHNMEWIHKLKVGDKVEFINPRHRDIETVESITSDLIITNRARYMKVDGYRKGGCGYIFQLNTNQA